MNSLSSIRKTSLLPSGIYGKTETVNEAYEVYEEMRDENQSLRDRIQQLKNIMQYYGIGIPPDD